MAAITFEAFALPLKTTYVKLAPWLIDSIKQKIEEIGGIEKFSKLSRIEYGYFYRFFKGKRCSLYFVFKLYNLLGIDIKTLNEGISEIVSGKSNSIGIKNPRLPFDFDNKCGGILLGGIMGDGSRTKLGGLTYNNQNEMLVKKVLNSAQDILGDVNYRLTWKPDKTLQLDMPKIAGDVVAKFGISKSYKTVSDCYVRLSDFSFEFKKNFIRQFFDDEGNVRRSDRRLQIKQTRELTEDSKQKIRKNVDKFAPKILIEIKKVLDEFGIRSTLALETLRFHNGKNMGDFSVSIYGKEYLEIFRRLINFSLEYKRSLLDVVIANYRFPSAPRNGRIEFALRYAKQTQNKYGFITKHSLAEESKRSLKTAAYFLVDLKKSGLVSVSETPRNKYSSLPKKYVLTHRGQIMKLEV